MSSGLAFDKGALGGASFVITANTNAFQAGMRRAEADAKRTHQVLSAELGGAALDVSRKLEGVGKSVESATAKMGGIGKGGRGAGLGLLQLGYAVDDLQYGFRSIVNNIPQMVYMMGGSAGLAGGAAIAAVAVNQLVEHWGGLMDLMKSGWLNVPAADLERLRVRAEKAGEAFDKLMLMPGKTRAAQIKALEEAFAEAEGGGPHMALKMIAEAMAQMPPGSELNPAMSDEQKKRIAMAGNKGIANLIGLPAGAAAKLEAEERKKVIAEIKKEREERARQLIGLAASGEAGGKDALGTIRSLINKFPKTFEGFPKFLKAMAETTEEAIEHRAANRSAAKALMGGSAFTDLLLGGGDRAAGGPTTQAQAMEMLRNHPLLRRLNPRAKEDVAKHLAGLSPEQAAGVMGGMTPKAIEDEAKKNFAGRVAPAAADMMRKAAEAAKAAGPGKEKPTALEERVGRMLKAAGIEGDAKGVVRDMQATLKDRIRAVMLEREVTEKQARQILLSERGRALARGFGPAQILGTDERSRQILAGGAGGITALPDLAKRQLEELMKIREALLAPAPKGGEAVAAGPR